MEPNKSPCCLDWLEWVSYDDELIIDVTHGLRHLPMLMLIAAHYLERVYGAQVKEIYYGALEMSQGGDTPVLKLSGLLQLLDRVQALSSYKANDDYGVFPNLLQQSGLSQPLSDTMKDAAFFERTMRPGQAKNRLKDLLNGLEQSTLDPTSGLFVQELRDRMNWVYEDKYYLRQKAQTRCLLKAHDDKVAATNALEAFIRKLVQDQGGNIDSFSNREEAKKNFEKNKAMENKSLYNAYKNLRDLRNALVNGDTQIRGDITSALSSETALTTFLENQIDTLFQKG